MFAAKSNTKQKLETWNDFQDSSLEVKIIGCIACSNNETSLEEREEGPTSCPRLPGTMWVPPTSDSICCKQNLSSFLYYVVGLSMCCHATTSSTLLFCFWFIFLLFVMFLLSWLGEFVTLLSPLHCPKWIRYFQILFFVNCILHIFTFS